MSEVLANKLRRNDTEVPWMKMVEINLKTNWTNAVGGEGLIIKHHKGKTNVSKRFTR